MFFKIFLNEKGNLKKIYKKIAAYKKIKKVTFLMRDIIIIILKNILMLKKVVWIL